MDKQQFNSLIIEGKYRWGNRELLVNSAINNQDFIFALLENIEKVNEKESVYSARILELAVKKNEKVLLPYLDNFCGLLKQVVFDGSVRACAKIIEIFCVEYFIKHNPLFIEKVSDDNLELFTEISFDWMITDRAIAIQAHSMYSLYLLGNKFDWIHNELIQVINKRLPTGSTGYKNRGKKIIKAIDTNLLLKLY